MLLHLPQRRTPSASFLVAVILNLVLTGGTRIEIDSDGEDNEDNEDTLGRAPSPISNDEAEVGGHPGNEENQHDLSESPGPKRRTGIKRPPGSAPATKKKKRQVLIDKVGLRVLIHPSKVTRRRQ